MNTILRVFWAHILVAIAALAIGYALAQLLVFSLVIVFLGAAWYLAQQRHGSGLEALLLYLFVIAGAAGFWLGIPGWLALVAVVAVLGAWDLDHFLQRLNAVSRVEFDSGLGREHLRRLVLVEGLGFFAGLLALTTHMNISFWWEALLVLLAFIGIRQLIMYVRKQMGE
jgi:hypothetical protein